MAVTRQQVAELYVATFNRAPDAAGLDYWVNDSGLTIEGIAQSFFDQPETQTLYPAGTTNTAFVTAIYSNLFNRTPDPAGLAYWVAELNNATMTRSVMIEAMKNGALGTDATIIANKATVGLAYADAGLEGTTFSLASVTEVATTKDAALLQVGDLTVAANGQSYAIAAASTGVTEGNPLNFTVTLGTAVSTDTVLNYQIQGVEVAGGTADPVTDLGILNGTVTVLAGSKTAIFTVTPTNDQITEGYEGFKIALLDSSFATIASSGNVVIADAANAGQTFTLTTGVDGAPAFTGGAGNDTYTAVIDGTATTGINNQTWTALDNLDGAAGTDILNINNISAAAKDATTLSLGTIANIETINIQSVAGITKTDNTYTADAADGTVGNGTEVDFSSISGLTTINATKSTAALVKAAATTDVNVSGATGLISVVGGKNISVTDATAAKAITVGNGAAAGDAAGTITITDTNNSGANAITVEGGTDVTVTATAAAQMLAGITVGDATNGTATGNVVITQNSTSDGAAIDHSAQTIAAVGGKTISITQNLTNTADIETDAGALKGAAITATADNATTDVTITQNATNTIFTKAAVTEVKASQTVTFNDLASGKTVTVNGLVFTAAKDLTAVEVAKAFANLTATDTQSEGGITTNGIYTLVNGTVAGWTSGAANGATVTFTGAANNTPTFAVASNDTASVPTKVYTAGTAFAAAIPSTNSVVMGSVVVDDNATKSITTITVDGATSVTLGGAAASGKDLNALTTLSLANVTGATALNTTATSLNMTVNDVATAANTAVAMNLDITAATIADLTLTSTGDASNLTLTAAAVKNLTVNAGAALTISAVSATNVLETVTVNGTAAVALGTIVDSTNLKSFNASANTGGVTATIDASTAASHADLLTFTFSEGNDVVTLDNTAINKNINLGAGDDSITLAAGVTAITKVIDGGTGSNTIAMTAAQAVTATADDVFEGKISNFQKLSIGATTAATTIDLANMDDISYVTTAGTGAAVNTNTLTLDNMANNGTVVLTTVNGATAGTVVNVKDAATNLTDVLNISLNSAGNLTGGLFTVANVETININSVDTEVAVTPTKNVNTVTVTADKATTVNVAGGNDLTLTLTGSDKVTLIDGSTMTGALTATTAVSTAATTIKGGSGNDSLTADTNNDVLMGGAGNDTLIVTSGNLVQLEGGAGKDTYQIGATSNQNAYATINGTAAELSGDVITFTTPLTGFSTAKIVLGSTAVFQDYVNEAAKGTAGTGTASYFVWDGNTYLVQDNNTATTFTNADDAIVKIAGVVDFTFNSTTNVLEIA